MSTCEGASCAKCGKTITNAGAYLEGECYCYECMGFIEKAESRKAEDKRARMEARAERPFSTKAGREGTKATWWR